MRKMYYEKNLYRLWGREDIHTKRPPAPRDGKTISIVDLFPGRLGMVPTFAFLAGAIVGVFQREQNLNYEKF